VASADLTREEALGRVRRKLSADLPGYAERCLIIRSKSVALIPLRFNNAQRHVHQALEEQKARTGRVRALILKGRQQGCSTYVQARFYHAVTHAPGRRAYILTHEDDATQNIFEIAERFHTNCPLEFRPSTGASNAKELSFSNLDSGYRVGTARTKGAGRSGTVQFFHGSEVAYWANAETHFAGVMQSIPDAAGTEVILESTSAGPTGMFATKWAEAVRGEGGYIAIFTPWFWQDEYRLPVPEDFEPTAEEENYAEKYGLDAGQIVWRRDKILELNGVWHFRREYPATPAEAFSAENPGALWTRKVIEEHRVHRPPLFRLMAVAVDPSTTSKATSNEAGIVWGGIGLNGHGYVMGDETRRARPIEWAKTAVAVYDEHGMEWLIYESNQGGEMVSDLIGTIDRGKKLPVAIKSVSASRAKRARAEPIAALYERGMVHHVGSHPALEDEMCTWDAENSNESPNRIDALVWLLTKLMLKRKTHRVARLDLGPEPEGKFDV
jgi:hypothetical protein